MVLGVLQTSRGIRFASLDVRPKKAVDIVRNSGAARKTAVSRKVLFMRPLSDEAMSADSTVGKRMIAAYTASHTGNKLVLDRPRGSALVTRLRSNTSKAVLALGAIASSIVVGAKRLLPRKVYSLNQGKHVTWPAMKLNRAQLSNMVATGIVAFGLASFALWVPAYTPTPRGGDQPISALGAGDDSQRSRETSSPSSSNTDSSAIGQDETNDVPSLVQTPASSTQPSTSTASNILPIGGSGGGTGVTQPVADTITPVTDPIIVNPVPTPTPAPSEPVTTDVVKPVVNTVDSTVNDTVGSTDGLLGGL